MFVSHGECCMSLTPPATGTDPTPAKSPIVHSRLALIRLAPKTRKKMEKKEEEKNVSLIPSPVREISTFLFVRTGVLFFKKKQAATSLDGYCGRNQSTKYFRLEDKLTLNIDEFRVA